MDDAAARCRRIVDAATPLVVDDLSWDDAGKFPLDGGVIDSLIYMRDVEGFTDRDLIGFTAHRTTLSDPVVARFLTVWREEEAGHAQAIDRFLAAYGGATGTPIAARQPPPPAEVSLTERVLSEIGGPVGSVVAAAHMAWGAANELLTLNGYRLLARRCAHPLLAELLRRIGAQEARHYSFYFIQAQRRLRTSPAARMVLPRLLSRSWTPVGVGDGYKSREQFARILNYLVASPDGAATVERMDRRYSALPSFDGLRIYRSAVESFGESELFDTAA